MKKLIPIFLVLAVFTGCNLLNSEKGLSDQGNKILDQTLYDKGIQSGDMTSCDQIIDKTMKTECTSIVNAGKLTSQATTQADVTLCKKIDLARYETACETQVKAIVEAKQADAKRLSIEQNALDKSDATICNEISNENQKATCKYNILNSQAVSKKDPSLCEGIGRKDLIDDCKRNLAK